MALIDNDTQTDIIDLVIFGFTLAVIAGILGFVVYFFGGRK